MGFFGFGKKNPVKGRQPGAATQERVIKPPMQGYNWEDSIAALQRDPDISDEALAAIMGLNTHGQEAAGNPIVQRYRHEALREILRRENTATVPGQQGEPTTGPLPETSTPPSTTVPAETPPDHSSQGLQTVQRGELNLVNYTPAQLMEQVNDTLSRVHFGMSKSRKYMHGVGDVWANIGPWVLFVGTVGEVFAFIWITTTGNDPKNNPAWWVALSILATVVSLEFTFAVVSFKSAAIRNDAERKPVPSDRDKKTLDGYRFFWYLLATFVGVGQAAFLIDAMTQHFSNLSWALLPLLLFAVLRTMGTLVSDYYTAFFHKETPTTAEQAKDEQEQRAAMAAQLLEQKSQEVTIINDGALGVMRAHAHADIERDSMETELQMKKMENTNRIATLRKQQEQANKVAELSTNIMGALMDPHMPDDQRAKVLNGLQALMQLHQNVQLPPPHGKVTVTEETSETDAEEEV